MNMNDLTNEQLLNLGIGEPYNPYLNKLEGDCFLFKVIASHLIDLHRKGTLNDERDIEILIKLEADIRLHLERIEMVLHMHRVLYGVE